MVNFLRNQLWVYEKSEGWIFWNFKHESVDEWSFFKLILNGWIPPSVHEIPEFISKSQCIIMEKRNEL